MAPRIERVIDSVELGEGPHWDQESQTLYFVDIFGKSIHKYVPSTKKHTKAVFDKPVSLIIPIEGKKNQFVITLGRELAIITWDGESTKVSSIEKICEVDQEPDNLENRINDGKCDPSGRLWAGTMGREAEVGHYTPEKGSLFSFEKGKVSKHVDKIGISNGLAFNTDLKKMYYNDSLKQTVDQFDFDIISGKISNRQVIFTLSKHNIPGFPDGMTIDTDGNLWVAIFNANRVIKIDPRRPETLLETITLPAKQITSVAFGGPNLNELYVTSAKFIVDGVILPPPDHGATYKVTGIGVKGLPGVPMKW